MPSVKAPSTATVTSSYVPVKPIGMVAAISVLGIVIFLSPPSARLWIVGIVIVMALLQRGGDAAAIINWLTNALYGDIAQYGEASK